MSVDLGTSKAKSDPNVVPLCDILLVLLIIFMVITPAAQKGIDIQLPDDPGPDAGVTANQIVLTLEADHTVKLNQEPVPMETLLGRLQQEFSHRQQKTIFIRADNTLPYKEVLNVMDITKGAGIEVIGVYVEPYTSPTQ